MNAKHIVTLVLALAAGAGVGSWTGGGIIHKMFSLAFCMGLGVPATIVLVIILMDRVRMGQLSRGTCGVAVFAAACALLSIGFAAGGEVVFRYRENDVKTFVYEVLPLLDAYKAKHGRYPEALTEVAPRTVPRYLAGERGYRSDGSTFTFYYESPESVMAGLLLSDSHRTWTIAD